MGPDPLLSELMKAYRFSITAMASGDPASVADGATALDRRARRSEIALALRRDLTCEACGVSFHYTFRVIAGRTLSYGQSGADSDMVRAAVERQLQRRIRCPKCHAIQHQDRRAFLRQERAHGLIGLVTVLGTVMGAAVLSGGGYLFAGAWGLIVGLGGSVALTLALTRWMLARLLAPLSS